MAKFTQIEEKLVAIVALSDFERQLLAESGHSTDFVIRRSVVRSTTRRSKFSV